MDWACRIVGAAQTQIAIAAILRAWRIAGFPLQRSVCPSGVSRDFKILLTADLISKQGVIVFRPRARPVTPLRAELYAYAVLALLLVLLLN